MSASPIEVVGQWLQNLLDPDVVNSVVAPDATYVSLNAENAELSKIHQWSDYGLSAVHDPGSELPSPCIYYGKIENGKFVRVYPSSGFSCSLGGLLHQSV